MAAWVEVTTNVLDIASFVLVTSLVVGREKFLAFVSWLLVRLEKAHRWHDEVYASRNWRIGPPHVLLAWVMLGVSTFWQITGRSMDPASAYMGPIVALVGGVTLAFILPAALALLARIITAVAGRHGIEGTLAILGAVTFMAARILAITSAVVDG